MMTVMIQEWLTVLIPMAASVVLVKLATLAVEEMAHAKVTSLIDSVSISLNILPTDVDECDIGIHSCDRNAMCSNTDGSFTCACHPGFTGDGLFCSE